MDTNLQPNSRVIFLYSLPKSVVEPMQMKGVDYNSVIKMIGDYDGVEVYDLNRDFFSKPHKCNILIILGEFLEDKNALLLQDNSTFPLADLTPLIGSSFREVNVIDCAWCYSGKGKTHDELKEYTNALVNTINSYTSAETRLALYWLLLKGTTLLGRDNYKDCYDKILGDLDAYQNGMDPKQLASLSEGTNLGTMATGEQPFEVKRNSRFYIRVIFHDDSAEETKRNNIKDARNIPYRIKEPILKELKDGDTVHLDLRFDTDNPEMTKFLHGGGEYSFLFIKDAENIGRYECFVEAGFREEIIHGTLKIKINDNPYCVDEWLFSIEVKHPENDLALDGNNNEHPSNRLHNNNRSPFNFTAIPKYPVPHTSKEEVNINTDDDNWKNLTTEERIKQAIQKVKEEKLIKYAYDYAFIMQMMNETDDMPNFLTPNSFLTYLQMLGIENLPKIDSLKKILSVITGSHPWKFTDNKGRSGAEALRRNKIAKRFHVLFTKGY